MTGGEIKEEKRLEKVKTAPEAPVGFVAPKEEDKKDAKDKNVKKEKRDKKGKGAPKKTLPKKAPLTKKPVHAGEGQKPVSFIPVFEVPASSGQPGYPAGLPVLDQKRIDVH